MTSSRQDWRRRIDYSAVKEADSLTHAIQGLLSRRVNPMREKEITAWFYGTPAKFVAGSIAKALDRGQIKGGVSSLSRNRRVMAYWVPGEWD